jgi:glucose/arabinose dehydrogenase
MQTLRIANETRHFGGRQAFGPDQMLYVTAVERRQGAPVWRMGVSSKAKWSRMAATSST